MSLIWNQIFLLKWAFIVISTSTSLHSNNEGKMCQVISSLEVTTIVKLILTDDDKTLNKSREKRESLICNFLFSTLLLAENCGNDWEFVFRSCFSVPSFSVELEIKYFLFMFCKLKSEAIRLCSAYFLSYSHSTKETSFKRYNLRGIR